MRLICPNCSTHYDVDASAIPPGGREVQCGVCDTVWFQPGGSDEAGEDWAQADGAADTAGVPVVDEPDVSDVAPAEDAVAAPAGPDLVTEAATDKTADAVAAVRAAILAEAGGAADAEVPPTDAEEPDAVDEIAAAVDAAIADAPTGDDGSIDDDIDEETAFEEIGALDVAEDGAGILPEDLPEAAEDMQEEAAVAVQDDPGDDALEDDALEPDLAELVAEEQVEHEVAQSVLEALEGDADVAIGQPPAEIENAETGQEDGAADPEDAISATSEPIAADWGTAAEAEPEAADAALEAEAEAVEAEDEASDAEAQAAESETTDVEAEAPEPEVEAAEAEAEALEPEVEPLAHDGAGAEAEALEEAAEARAAEASEVAVEAPEEEVATLEAESEPLEEDIAGARPAGRFDVPANTVTTPISAPRSILAEAPETAADGGGAEQAVNLGGLSAAPFIAGFSAKSGKAARDADPDDGPDAEPAEPPAPEAPEEATEEAATQAVLERIMGTDDAAEEDPATDFSATWRSMKTAQDADDTPIAEDAPIAEVETADAAGPDGEPEVAPDVQPGGDVAEAIADALSADAALKDTPDDAVLDGAAVKDAEPEGLEVAQALERARQAEPDTAQEEEAPDTAADDGQLGGDNYAQMTVAERLKARVRAAALAEEEARRNDPGSPPHVPLVSGGAIAGAGAAAVAAASARDVDAMPDARALTSSLRESGSAEPGMTRSSQAAPRNRFPRGFSTALLVFALLALAYIFHQPIGERVPQVRAPLEAYAQAVDRLRGNVRGWFGVDRG